MPGLNHPVTAVVDAPAFASQIKRSPRLSLRKRTFLCQLPLSITTAMLAVSALIVSPGLLESLPFQLGLLFHVVLLCLCLAVPWDRLFRGAVLSVPVVDFVIIGLSGTGASEPLPVLWLLAVFPVVWLSSFGIMPTTSLLLCFAGPLLMVALSALPRLSRMSTEEIWAATLTPLMMFAVALTIRFASMEVARESRGLQQENAKEDDLSAGRSNMDEQRITAILDSVNVGLTVIDGNGDRQLSNRQQRFFEQLASPLNGEAGRYSDLVFSADQLDRLPAESHPLNRAARGETYSNYLVWLGENENQRAVTATAQRINGNDSELFIVLTDVTELADTIAARDNFISTFSHELRTPLTSIVGHLDLVLQADDEMPPLTEEYLQIAGHNAERLLDLTRDILSTAADPTSINPRLTNLAEVITSRVRSASAMAKKAGINLVQDVSNNVLIYIDPLRIGQVLDNLITNAIKYSPSGGTVTVRAHENNSYIRLEVDDQGIGIGESELDQIFSRFFRSRSIRKAGIPGTGLGLTIAKTIVENHHGTISCTSEPGTGTKFTVKLPFNPPATHPSQGRRPDS